MHHLGPLPLLLSRLPALLRIWRHSQLDRLDTDNPRVSTDADSRSDDWGSVEAAALAEWRARTGTQWLVCCGRSSPLQQPDADLWCLHVQERGRMAGQWLSMSTALALVDSAVHGVVLSHCLEDEYAPLSQLDEALRVLRPGGQLSVWLWGMGGAGQSPGPAIARRSLQRLQRWARSKPLQRLAMIAMERSHRQLSSIDLATVAAPRRWWLQRRAALLRLDYRYSGSQGIGVRRSLPVARRVSLPAQGLSRV